MDQMKRLIPFWTALVPAFFASGCVYALMAYSQPADVKLKLRTASPREYVARVKLEASADYVVDANGRVQFPVPPFRNGCSTYCLGIKIHDGSAQVLQIVELRRAEHVVRRLSLADIAKLPEDEEGYRIVRIRK